MGSPSKGHRQAHGQGAIPTAKIGRAEVSTISPHVGVSVLATLDEPPFPELAGVTLIVADARRSASRKPMADAVQVGRDGCTPRPRYCRAPRSQSAPRSCNSAGKPTERRLRAATSSLQHSVHVSNAGTPNWPPAVRHASHEQVLWRSRGLVSARVAACRVDSRAPLPEGRPRVPMSGAASRDTYS